jgi:hypothetical protein
LLLIAAALLTASMHSLGVVEAPVAPAAHSIAVRATSTTTVTDPSSPHPVMTGVQLTAEDLGTAHGRTFLVDLSRLDRSALVRASSDRRVLATAQDRPPAASDVATWWGGLGGGERRMLETAAPSVVGNLEGVPYDVRDRANRSVLRAGLADPAVGAARSAMLGQVEQSLVHQPGAPRRNLITLDTRGSGRAAIAIGDLDTAADVTVVVPGMFFTVTGQMTDFTNTANDLYSEQATLSGVAAPGSGSGVAVVAWMGYRTPDLSNILSLGLAKTGAGRLERAVDGLRQIREGEQPRVNIVAHSYGSTTAMMALSSGRMSADTLTVLGSPGSDVQTSRELSVGAGQVFVGEAHSDPIAGSGYFGTDPGSSAFGSTVLDLAGGADRQDTGDVFRRPVGHNDYLKPGTASLHDVALIAVGRGDLVQEQLRRGGGGKDGVPQTSPDMYLVRPQDLQPRD